MRNLYQVFVSVLITTVFGMSAGVCADAVKPQSKPATPAAVAKSPPAEAPASDPNDYHIGSLDLLEIKVLQAADMSRTLRVDARGNISMPLIGVVHVAGLTAYEVEQLVAAKLEADYIQNPQVSVFIKEFTSQRVTVQGAVKKAGLYDFQGQATLLQAISMGGGLDVKANENAIKVVRLQPDNSSHTLVYDLAAIRQNKAPNPTLKGGDIVVVEDVEPITVEGAVARAGIFYLSGSPTLMQLISQAGGLHEIADPSSIKVFGKGSGNKKSVLEYDLDKIRDGKIDDPVLHAGDVVVVERSAVRSVINGVTGTLRGFVGFRPVN